MNAIICFIIKYAFKSETSSKTYMDFIENMCADQNQNNRAKTILTKLIIFIITERNYCAQEVAHILMSWPLHGSSRASSRYAYVNKN